MTKVSLCLTRVYKVCSNTMLEVGGAEDDYESLFDVMVSDRLKDCLPTGALRYVLSREGDECYSSEKIAKLADILVNNFQDEKYKGNAVTNFDIRNQKSSSVY